jgi:hypothetical protein
MGRWGDTERHRNGDAETLNHAPNHVGFGIGPELCVVQDRVKGRPCEPLRVQGGPRTMLGSG